LRIIRLGLKEIPLPVEGCLPWNNWGGGCKEEASGTENWRAIKLFVLLNSELEKIPQKWYIL
jgi:hypothetical protein